jgi:hypothetical protein
MGELGEVGSVGVALMPGRIGLGPAFANGRCPRATNRSFPPEHDRGDGAGTGASFRPRRSVRMGWHGSDFAGGTADRRP